MTIETPDTKDVAGQTEAEADAVADDASHDHWLRLPTVSVPRIEVTDVHLPDIRLPRVVGPAVRRGPDETRRRFDALVSATAATAMSLGARLAKAGGRALVIRRPSSIARAGSIARASLVIPVVGLIVVAAGTGAALAYVLDPISGRERRAGARRRIGQGKRRIGLGLGRARDNAVRMISVRVQHVPDVPAIAESAPTQQPLRSASSVGKAHTRAMSMAGASTTDTTAGNGLGG